MADYSSKTSTSAISSTHKSSSVPPRLLRLFALYENMVRFVLPLCSSLSRPNPETPIVSTTNIVDISGVGLKQFWNLKGHMQDASVLATAHYPETLDRIFVRSSHSSISKRPSLTFSTRSLAPLRSSLQSGAGLNAGSTLIPPPKFLFCPLQKSSPPSHHLWSHQVSPNSTGANLTGTGATCPASTMMQEKLQAV